MRNFYQISTNNISHTKIIDGLTFMSYKECSKCGKPFEGKYRERRSLCQSCKRIKEEIEEERALWENLENLSHEEQVERLKSYIKTLEKKLK